tara:strand:- start:454 stop:846 length:393 start_codon:yes stop_codon:yes gene_type:complete
MTRYKVQKIKNVDWGNTKALVNIDALDPLGNVTHTIRDCKLIQGDFGSFVASPSYKLQKPYENKSTGKMVEYQDVIYFEKDFRDELNEVVALAYDPNAEFGEWYSDDFVDTNTTASVDIEKLTTLTDMPG